MKCVRASGVLELPRDEPEAMALDAILNLLKSSTSKCEILSGFLAGEGWERGKLGASKITKDERCEGIWERAEKLFVAA